MGLSIVLPTLLSLLLAASTTAGPDDYSGKTLVITKNFFLDSNIKYIGQHDIVNIIMPLNRINFADDNDDDSEDEDPENVTLFFTEADVDANGDKQYQGLYVFKDNKATKLLANGRDAAALNDDTKKVYLGAADGIYIYEKGNTKKYGSLTDSIIQIEADNQTGTIYFLTEDHQLFSVADEGTNKNKVESVTDVREFVIDYLSNIYYYDSGNQLNVFNQEGIKKFDGLKATAVKLVRPMFALEEGVFAVIDDKLYLLYPNGTSSLSRVSLAVKPTAYAPDATLLQYYALDKKIYEFNVQKLLTSELSEIKDFLDEKKDDIQNIATKSRSEFGE